MIWGCVIQRFMFPFCECCLQFGRVKVFNQPSTYSRSAERIPSSRPPVISNTTSNPSGRVQITLSVRQSRGRKRFRFSNRRYVRLNYWSCFRSRHSSLSLVRCLYIMRFVITLTHFLIIGCTIAKTLGPPWLESSGHPSWLTLAPYRARV